MLSHLRRHLSWKLFLSYLVVIVVGSVVLASAAEFAVPSAFDRHMSAMAAMMGGRMMGIGNNLFTSFRNAVTEALTLAAVAAFLAAVAVSLFVSRRVVLPVQEMMAASQRIAEGHYAERVGVPGSAKPDELDELDRLAVSFNQMAARLEQTEARRVELVGNVAHELRTPLTSIKGYMEGLMDGVLPAEPSTFLQVHREADRLERLVQDLQELSRVEAGAVELNLRPTTVSRLVEEVTTRLGHQFEEKGVDLEVDVPSGLPRVLVDGDRIGQVLLNLVGNALQYTPPGGRVTLSARHEGVHTLSAARKDMAEERVRLMVKDTGIGISSQHLPHVFERFYRVDKSRSRAGGGSGIGLTIARHLVEAHGGQLEAASDGLGKGSSFSLTLAVA